MRVSALGMSLRQPTPRCFLTFHQLLHASGSALYHLRSHLKRIFLLLCRTSTNHRYSLAAKVRSSNDGVFALPRHLVAPRRTLMLEATRKLNITPLLTFPNRTSPNTTAPRRKPQSQRVQSTGQLYRKPPHLRGTMRLRLPADLRARKNRVDIIAVRRRADNTAKTHQISIIARTR